MAPGTRRLSRSLPLLGDDQCRCCGGGPLGPSESSSHHDAHVHHHLTREASVPSEPSTPPSSVGSTVSGHGPTRGKGLDKLMQLTGHKLTIEIQPVLGRPTDEVQSAKLSNEIGVLSKDNISKKYNKWSDVPETDKVEFTRLNMRIDVDTFAPHAKRTCTELAMARRRGSNHEFHKLFQNHSSVEEARAHCPLGLSQADWDKKNTTISLQNPLRNGMRQIRRTEPARLSHTVWGHEHLWRIKQKRKRSLGGLSAAVNDGSAHATQKPMVGVVTKEEMEERLT